MLSFNLLSDSQKAAVEKVYTIMYVNKASTSPVYDILKVAGELADVSSSYVISRNNENSVKLLYQWNESKQNSESIINCTLEDITLIYKYPQPSELSEKGYEILNLKSAVVFPVMSHNKINSIIVYGNENVTDFTDKMPFLYHLSFFLVNILSTNLSFSSNVPKNIGIYNYDRLKYLEDILIMQGKHMDFPLVDSDMGLISPYVFKDVLKALVKVCSGGSLLALCVIDITDFSRINEQYGHKFGDVVLDLFAKKLSSIDNPNSYPVYLGGDNFALVCVGYNSRNEIMDFADELYALTSSTFEIDNNSIKVNSCIGIAVYDEDTIEVDELEECAKFALKSARDLGANAISLYEAKVYEEYKTRRNKIWQMPVVIGKKQFYPVYQPIVDARTGEIYGYEGLSRVTNPMFPNIADLINTAQGSPYSAELCLALSYNVINGFKNVQNKKLFINFDGAALTNNDINIDVFLAEVNSIGLNYSDVVIEFMENTKLNNSDLLEILKEKLKSKGIQIAIDDFGSGYSNELSLLVTRPDIIKIDRGIASGVDTDRIKARVISSFISFAHDCGIKVIAEGVETQSEMSTLIEIGVDYLQGYYISRPAPELGEIPPAVKNEIISAANRCNIGQSLFL